MLKGHVGWDCEKPEGLDSEDPFQPKAFYSVILRRTLRILIILVRRISVTISEYIINLIWAIPVNQITVFLGAFKFSGWYQNLAQAL